MAENSLTILLVVSVLSLGVCAAQENETANIVDTAKAAGNFDTLVAAIESANLTEMLSVEGPFTVFAPTDDAFDLLPPETLPTLLNNTDALTEVLSYHVAEGKLMASDVVGLVVIPTLLEGGNLTVNVTEGEVTVDGARIIQPDIDASNGVIHVIDAVLIPPFEEVMETAEGAGAEAQPICVSNTTREVLQSLNISRFASLTLCEPETKVEPTCLSETPCA